MNFIMRYATYFILLLFALSISSIASAETVKIAVIDGFSGGFSAVVNNQYRSLKEIIKLANDRNWAGEDIDLKAVAFDGKSNPRDSVAQLKVAIGQGYHYIAQGGGSAVGIALLEAIKRHNRRYPNDKVVYLNYASIDPAMTNSKCSFWHFEFDANTDMKLRGLIGYLAKDKSIKKVFLIGQNYSFGQHVSKKSKEFLKKMRPDMQIVGDVLHPVATVKDFSPYVAEIKASNADAIVTGNWGNDLALLVKAAKDASLDIPFYTFYANNIGVPIAMGSAGVGLIHNITSWNPNDATGVGMKLVESFKEQYDGDFYQMPIFTAVKLFSTSIRETGSTDPVKVAYAMEGMSVKSLNGKGTMRAADHQYQQAMVITTWEKVDGDKVRYDQGGTGYGWLTEESIPAKALSTPTTCQMERPPQP